MKERNKATPAVYLILRRGDELLLMRRQGSGYYDGWYSVPAGHLDAGELPTECLIRETQEELGIQLHAPDLKLEHVMYRTKHDDTGDRLDIFFSTKVWTGQPTIQEPHKCDDVRWFPLNALPEQMMHHVRCALKFIAEGKIFSQLSRAEIETLQNPRTNRS